jgi:hypothetical protein
MSKLKLIDFIKINPDPSFSDLSKKDKVQLMDGLLNRHERNRGLLVTYDLSHSGRRINNRIYTTTGQKWGIDTLLKPYPKPILQHHDDGSDPIGRFVGGAWQDTSSGAISFFDNVNDYMEVQAAYDSDNPERIYKTMKKHGLLTRKKWPGLGRMRVSARISDETSIEKFLDGRYITFSAGSTTDRHSCSVCQQDWAQGDICEHRHGKVYDDELCVFVTGKFEVLEGSVVNMPADDLSQVLSMELADSTKIEDVSSIRVDNYTVYLTDSKYNISEKNMSEKTNETDSVTKVSQDLSSEENTTEETEIVAETVVETVENNVDVSDETDQSSKAELKDDSSEMNEDFIKAVASRIFERMKKELKIGGAENGAMENSTTTSGEKQEKETKAIDKVENNEREEGTKEEGLLQEVVADSKVSENNNLKVAELESSLSELKVDYTKALKTIEQLEKTLHDALSRLSKKLGNNISLEKTGVELDQLVEWFGSIDRTDQTTQVPSTQTVVDNPSIASSDDQVSSKESSTRKNLGTFEKNVVETYEQIYKKDGLNVAERFLRSKKRYLRRGFHPKIYIQLGE